MLPVYLAGPALLLFVAGVLRDPRSFSNAVFLGLGLALGTLGAAHRLADTSGVAARLVALALGLLVAFGPVVVASYLVLNGITMARRESIRPANLLSLLAGIAAFGLIGLMIVTLWAQSADLTVFTVITVLLSGYISFLLASYVIYAFVYGRTTGLRRADFVVVLGSGLIGGDRVPPLLASRLERGRQVYQAHYGNGHLLVPDELEDQRFGLRFLVRRLDSGQVHDLVRRRPDARGRTDSTLVPAGAPVWTLGIAENVEIIRRIGGHAKDLKVTFSSRNDRPVNVEGSAGLRMRFGVEPAALLADVRECERVCAEEEPDQALSFVETLRRHGRRPAPRTHPPGQLQAGESRLCHPDGERQAAHPRHAVPVLPGHPRSRRQDPRHLRHRCRGRGHPGRMTTQAVTPSRARASQFRHRLCPGRY